MVLDWSKLRIDKGQATVAALLVAILPWLGGGRDPAGLVTIYGACVVGLFLVWRLRYDVAAKPNLTWPAVLLGGWALLSLVWSANRYQTTVWVIGLALIYVLFNLAYQLSRRPRLFDAWMNGYLAIAASASLYGFGLYLTSGADRLTSIFGAAVPMAAFLLPAIMVGWWRFMHRGGWFYGAITIINLAAFILVGSRGATLILAILSFICLSVTNQSIGHWVKIVFVLAIGLGLAIGLNVIRVNLPKNLTTTAASQPVATTSDRLDGLRSALAIWSDHPLVGTGAGTFATIHPQYQYHVTSASSDAGNLYLQTVSELGLVGGVLVVWLMVELFGGLWRGGRAVPELGPMAIGLSALLVQLGVSGAGSFPVILALAAILAGFSYQAPESASEPAKFRLLLTTTALVLVAVPIVSDYRSRVLASNGQINQANDDVKAAANDFQAAQHQLTYDPTVLTSEAADDLTLAAEGHDVARNLARATGLAELARRLDRFDAAPDFWLGQAESAQKHDAAAELAFREALTLDPYNHPEYYNGLAELYLSQAKLTAALDLEQQVTALYSTDVLARLSPSDPSLTVKLAQSYADRASALVRLGRVAEARTDIARSLGLDEANATAQRLLSQIGAQAPGLPGEG